jgi:hypothetical protein
MDWTFGKSIEERLLAVPGSATYTCPNELISEEEIYFECEDFPKPASNN